MYGRRHPWFIKSPPNNIFKSKIHQDPNLFVTNANKLSLAVLMATSNIGRKARMYGHRQPWFLEPPPNLICLLRIHQDPKKFGTKCHYPSMTMLRAISNIAKEDQNVWPQQPWFLGSLLNLIIQICNDPPKSLGNGHCKLTLIMVMVVSTHRLVIIKGLCFF